MIINEDSNGDEIDTKTDVADTPTTATTDGEIVEQFDNKTLFVHNLTLFCHNIVLGRIGAYWQIPCDERKLHQSNYNFLTQSTSSTTQFQGATSLQHHTPVEPMPSILEVEESKSETLTLNDVNDHDKATLNDVKEALETESNPDDEDTINLNNRTNNEQNESQQEDQDHSTRITTNTSIQRHNSDSTSIATNTPPVLTCLQLFTLRWTEEAPNQQQQAITLVSDGNINANSSKRAASGNNNNNNMNTNVSHVSNVSNHSIGSSNSRNSNASQSDDGDSTDHESGGGPLAMTESHVSTHMQQRSGGGCTGTGGSSAAFKHTTNSVHSDGDGSVSSALSQPSPSNEELLGSTGDSSGNVLNMSKPTLNTTASGHDHDQVVSQQKISLSAVNSNNTTGGGSGNLNITLNLMHFGKLVPQSNNIEIEMSFRRVYFIFLTNFINRLWKDYHQSKLKHDERMSRISSFGSSNNSENDVFTNESKHSGGENSINGSNEEKDHFETIIQTIDELKEYSNCDDCLHVFNLIARFSLELGLYIVNSCMFCFCLACVLFAFAWFCCCRMQIQDTHI